MSEKPKKRQKTYEEDGVYVSTSDHWELIEIPLMTVGGKGYLGIRLPRSLVSHLGLERGDILTVALNHEYVRKNERKKLSLESIKLPLKVNQEILGKHALLVQEFLNSSLSQAKITLKEYNGIMALLYRHRHPEFEGKIKVHFVQGIGWIEKTT